MRESTGLAMAVLAVIGLSLTACSGSLSLSAETVEQTIEKQLSTDFGIPVEEISDISCPSDLAGEVGTTMVCTLDNGLDEFDVIVTVTSIDGSTILFSVDIDDSSFE